MLIAAALREIEREREEPGSRCVSLFAPKNTSNTTTVTTTNLEFIVKFIESSKNFVLFFAILFLISSLFVCFFGFYPLKPAGFKRLLLD